MTIVLLSVVLVHVCSCANTTIWATIVQLSVVLVLVCLCADTLIWARRALSFSLVWCQFKLKGKRCRSSAVAPTISFGTA